MPSLDSFNSKRTLTAGGKTYTYFSIEAAAENGLGDVSRLPASLKVLLENMLRFEDGKTVTKDDILAFKKWLDNKGKDGRCLGNHPRPLCTNAHKCTNRASA